MSLTMAGLFFVMVVAGFTVTGIVGFGANVLMMPILSMVFPIQSLVLVFVFISFVNALYRVVENHRGIIWREFLPMVAISMAGSLLGLWVFRILPELWLKLLLGIFVVAMAVYNLATHRRTETTGKPAQESLKTRLFYRILLFIGGFLHGSFVCGGPMYVIYCDHYYGDSRAHFRGMQFGIVFLNSTLIVCLNFWHGLYNASLILPSVLGVCALLVAFFVSAVLLKHLRDGMLYLLVQIVLLISGISLIWQSAPGVIG